MSLQPFTQVSGQAAPLLAANIDTDVIMPKQFLKGIDRRGLDRGVFFDLRFLRDGRPDPDFVLNQPAWQEAKFLVVGHRAESADRRTPRDPDPGDRCP